MNKKNLLFLLMLLPLVASAQTKRTIHVATAGTLSDYISNEEKYQIEELTLTGELNGSDFRLIRDMAGIDSYYKNSDEGVVFINTDGRLKTLDISNAAIVGGGSYYMETDGISCTFCSEFLYTQDNCISTQLFYQTKLESIILPNNVTSIGGGAFADCSALTSITISNNVTTIEGGAFQGCFGIKDFYCWANNVPSTNDWTFDMTPCNSATLHVPAGSVDTYKNTYPWSLFGTTVALTDDDPKPTGINSLKEDRPNHPTGIYSLDGKRLQKELRGLNIIRMNNGKTTKSYFK